MLAADAQPAITITLTAIVKIRNLQNEAFNQLVDEKLGADESFRIFITLSNDVLRQLGGIASASD